MRSRKLSIPSHVRILLWLVHDGSPPQLNLQKKAHADLPTVPEIAHLRGQSLRLQCSAVRIGSIVC